ncbi:ribonuclease H-like domain-containing protein [Tanacetum coccineum]
MTSYDPMNKDIELSGGVVASLTCGIISRESLHEYLDEQSQLRLFSYSMLEPETLVKEQETLNHFANLNWQHLVILKVIQRQMQPAGVNIVRSMWLFKHKFHADGTLNCYKARLVANGSSQQLDVGFDEMFSPVVNSATIRTVLSLVVTRQWHIHQLNVKNAFLNGDLSETVYMHQPPDFVDNRYPHHVCLLQRSLYGLKQAPRAWFQRFAGYATRAGFYQSRFDSLLFIYRQGSQVAYLLIYVDAIILTASCPIL